MPDDSRHVRVAIVGAGLGGIGTAIRLRQRGMDDFVILERAGDIGGTWRDNSYPGCACDVESHLYSFSFDLNPDWSRAFSPQPEIQEYLRRCAARHGVMPHVRLNHEVLDARWDAAAARWRIRTTQGDWTAPVLVLAQGALSDPSIPALPGLERFRGTVFHSARWDHAHDLAGERVAVIGTGASAIQLVPAIQPVVGKLSLFQRTPSWIIPRHDHPIPKPVRRLFRRLRPLQRLLRLWLYLRHELFLVAFRHPRVARLVERYALRHLRASAPDPALRAKLTPRYTIGCKRILLSNDYLPAVAQPNVELVTEGIAEVREDAIVDGTGAAHPVDTIIFATGFQPTTPPLAHHVHGRDGRTLAEAWAGSPRAHVGTTCTGFPSLFMLMGPNTGLGHSSVVYMIEAQIAHLLGALDEMRRRGAVAIEPRPEAQAAWLAHVERKMRGTVWVAGHCASWYLDATGRNSTLWPDFTWRFRRRVARFRPEEYELRPAAAPAPRPAGVVA